MNITKPQLPDSAKEFPEFARKHLDCRGLLDKSGGILCSSYKTLEHQPNGIYLLGINPGGESGSGPCLKKDIRNLKKDIRNLKKDIRKRMDHRCLGEDWSTTLWTRVCWLLIELGQDPREVCASNLIFLQSRDVNALKLLAKRLGKTWRCLADDCWQVHEAILGIVRPKMILVYGELPYTYLKNIKDRENGYIDPETTPCGKIKGFQLSINGKLTSVVGVPHMSGGRPSYNPIEKEDVVKWIRGKL